jgi:hypothetical protein
MHLAEHEKKKNLRFVCIHLENSFSSPGSSDRLNPLSIVRAKASSSKINFMVIHCCFVPISVTENRRKTEVMAKTFQVLRRIPLN